MKRIGLTESVIKKLQEYRDENSLLFINSYIPKATSKTNFEGFRVDTTGTSFYDDFLPTSKDRDYVLKKDRSPDIGDGKNWWHYTDSYIAEVTPQEYFDLCYKYVFDSNVPNIKDYTDPDRVIYKYDADQCQMLAHTMKKGTKMYLPFINFRSQSQEGRHRAGAAYLLGIETIPVLIIK